MKAIFTFLVILNIFSSLGHAAELPVLRVSSTLQPYSINQPWEKRAPYERNGLGILVGKNQILTTAEMVANATFIELQTINDEHTIIAKAIAIDYEANLALLSATEASDIELLNTMTPIQLSPPAKLGDKVEMIQVEDNGMHLKTAGVIRGVDVTSSLAPGHYFLTYEVRATMQSATNSFTIPVIKDNKLLGLLTSYSSDDQLSDVTAPEIISAFLKDASDGHYVGFPSLGIKSTRTTDKYFRKWLKLGPQQGGIFVTSVKRNSSAKRADIRIGDVILKLSDHSIDRRGYYQSKNYGKLHWNHLIRGAHKTGDSISITLQRDGQLLTKHVQLTRPPEGIIPTHSYDKAPLFMINGGLIFQELTQPYLRLFGKSWRTSAPLSLLDAYNHPEKYEKDHRRIVILSHIIPTEATLGYERLRNIIVKKVNGKNITDIPALIAAFKSPQKNNIHAIELEGPIKTIYLDADTANKVNTLFLQQGLPMLYRDKE